MPVLRRSVSCFFAAAIFCSPKPCAADSTALFDFDQASNLANIITQDARVHVEHRANKAALRLETGVSASWPGITLRAPSTPWDLSRFATVILNVRNIGSNAATVSCRLDNEGADGNNHCVTGSTTIAPGANATLAVPLTRYGDDKLRGKLFGMRGYPKSFGGERTIDPSHITQLLLFVTKPSQSHTFEIDSIEATGTFVAPTARTSDADPFFPFIDTFGQYRHRDWPGKVRSIGDLQMQKFEETKELTAHNNRQEWDKFGGWITGPQLKTTGFFRTEKREDKWWLVDPEGRLFWSHGIDCVRMLDATPIDERESWFEDFPGGNAEFAAFFTHGYALKGHYAGRTVKSFSFAGANLQRKYGSNWRGDFGDVVHRRLRSWGLNTIGNWSDESVRLQRRTPYTDAIGSNNARRVEGSDGYWGKFADPFDSSFRAVIREAMAGKRAKSASDPWCIGYFTDNEIAWGDEISLALAALSSPADQPAKSAFIDDLVAKYGSIEKLNTAWGATNVSWDALRQSRSAPDKKKAREDLEAFYSRIAETYFRTAREAIKEVAPNQLYLGCRFAWVNPRAASAAAKYCDVVSYNLYRRSVANFEFNGGADVPLIIGEFHLGALDRGMFHTGLVPTASQAERAQTYLDYVIGALEHPQFVGCHWFQYHDEPTTGRVYDEENYQIGFVDIADTPYRELVSASRTVASRMYQVRAKPSTRP